MSVKVYRSTRLGQFSPAEADIATFELMHSDLEAEAKREIPMATDTDTQNTPDIDDTELSLEQRSASVLCYRNIMMFLPIIHSN